MPHTSGVTKLAAPSSADFASYIAPKKLKWDKRAFAAVDNMDGFHFLFHNKTSSS